MIGMSPQQKIAAINKVFADSYKSPLSFIVVDNIERLLGKQWINHFDSQVHLIVFRMGPYWSELLERCSSGASRVTCPSPA